MARYCQAPSSWLRYPLVTTTFPLGKPGKGIGPLAHATLSSSCCTMSNTDLGRARWVVMLIF